MGCPGRFLVCWRGRQDEAHSRPCLGEFGGGGDGDGGWATQSAQLDRELGEARLSWLRGWRIALRSIPLHGDPAAVLDCCTLAAATAAGRLWKATPSNGKVLEGDAVVSRLLLHLYRAYPRCLPDEPVKSGSQVIRLHSRP